MLTKSHVVELYSTFDDLLSQLSQLAARRHLFDNEPYSATRPAKFELRNLLVHARAAH